MAAALFESSNPREEPKMATIQFVNGSDRKFLTVEERMETDPELAEIVKRYPPGELKGASFTHHEGAPDELLLFEMKFPANTKVETHAHDADEIIVVTEGEIQFGKQLFGIGSSVFIPKMTLYSFQAGPNGLTFLNFRPTRSAGAITKDDFMAMRSQASQASA
jgi:hypothetical protein